AKMSSSVSIKLVVIKEETVSYPLPDSILRFTQNEALARRLSPLLRVTVDDYVNKNKKAKSLSRALNLKLPYVFFTKDDERIFESSNGWETYAQKFPDSGGFISLSSVGFNSERNQAVLYVARNCGRLCGGGFIAVLTKVDGVWS